MRRIADLIDNIDDELLDAKNYAEKYIELKAAENLWANKFLDMASSELVHADLLHQYLIEQIEQIKKVYVLPVELERICDNSHRRFVEDTAWIKQMISM